MLKSRWVGLRLVQRFSGMLLTRSRWGPPAESGALSLGVESPVTEIWGLLDSRLHREWTPLWSIPLEPVRPLCTLLMLEWLLLARIPYFSVPVSPCSFSEL